MRGDRIGRAIMTLWRRGVGDSRPHAEDGFTLIELLIVCLILPIIVGGIAFALVSLLSLQQGVQNRVSDAADAQTVSTYYENDVQSAAGLTTSASGTLQCGIGTQLLGLAWSPNKAGQDQTVVSYAIIGSGSTDLLVRQYCASGVIAPRTIAGTVTLTSTTALVDTARSFTVSDVGETVSGADIATGTTIVAYVSPTQVTMGQAATGSLTQGTVTVWTTPTGTATISSDICLVSPTCPSGQPTVTVTPASDNTAAASGWIPTAGSSRQLAVTGVTLAITEPKSNFSYTLVSVPKASSSSGQLGAASSPTTGCGFTTPGTSQYASSLCFVDFSKYLYTEYNNATPGSCQTMTAAIADTPYTLSFCLSTTVTEGDGYTEANPAPFPTRPSVLLSSLQSAWAQDPVPANYPYPAVVPWVTPTYSDPPTSEAFLGNNGFYTGIPGAPALYQNDEGSFGTVSMTNIKLTTSNGTAATNWKLVTGDAESTDGCGPTSPTGPCNPAEPEYLIWTSDESLYLLPNSPTSPIGNACADVTSPNGLTGLTSSGAALTPAQILAGQGGTTIECEGEESSDKTGTVMLAALTPTQLTVQMQGQGLEAIFVGVLLP